MSRIWPESHCTQAIGHQLLTDWTEFSEIDRIETRQFEQLWNPLANSANHTAQGLKEPLARLLLHDEQARELVSIASQRKLPSRKSYPPGWVIP
jgi:hypothetical protein